MTSPLGLVGLGNMGAPIARRLRESGRDLVVFDANPEALKAAAAIGARLAPTARGVGDSAETIFVSLPTPRVVEEVLLGEGGLREGTRVRRIVDLSTTGATVARAIAGRLQDDGIQYIDAPVSGGTQGAERGTLALMVSAPDEHVEAVAESLAVLGRVFRIGTSPGEGQVMKLLNNYLNATALAASSEALVFGVKAGLDPDLMIEVLNASTGRNSATEEKIPRAVLTRSFSAGFTFGLMCKDLALYRDEVHAAGAPSKMADEMLEHWTAARDLLGANTDFSTIIRPMEEAAGVEVRSRK